MSQILNQIALFLQQAVTAIVQFIVLVWTWSFGQIVAIFQSNWQALPVWKIVVLAIVVLAIAYVLSKAVFQLWAAAEQILKAFIGLLSVLVSLLPFVLVAGLIAAVGGYVIQNVNL